MIYSTNKWFIPKITFRGITGLVGFDQSGFRSSITLDVMTLTSDGLQKVCLSISKYLNKLNN